MTGLLRLDLGDIVYFHIVRDGKIQLEHLVITRMELWEGNLYVGDDKRLIDSKHVKKVDKNIR